MYVGKYHKLCEVVLKSKRVSKITDQQLTAQITNGDPI